MIKKDFDLNNINKKLCSIIFHICLLLNILMNVDMINDIHEIKKRELKKKADKPVLFVYIYKK